MTTERDTEQQESGLTARRAYVWLRRLTGLLIAFIALTLALFLAGLPTHWVAIAASMTCAEITRRIMAESYPTQSLRWRDLLSRLLDKDVSNDP